MAGGRIALVAEDRTRFFLGKIDHLSALGHRFRKLELSGVYPLEIVFAASPRRGTAIRRSPKSAKVEIFDPGLGQGISQWRFRKAGAA